MKYSQPTVLTLCFSAKIQQRVIECINKKNVIAIHLDKDIFNKVSLKTIREIGFDLIIFDEEYSKDYPVSNLQSILPETRFLVVLSGDNKLSQVRYEFGSITREDLEDIVTVYQPYDCEIIDRLINYLLQRSY